VGTWGEGGKNTGGQMQKKIPSPNDQTPKKSQIPITKIQRDTCASRSIVLEFGYWDLGFFFGVWILDML
jgi:hypothetical protein